MPLPALAGDAALADFIGFSEDGQTFAFEEYGIQDGSGFAYSTIYRGRPHRRQMGRRFALPHPGSRGEGDRPLATVRADARALATATLDTLAIATPAETLWLDGTSTGDGKNIGFLLRPLPR